MFQFSNLMVCPVNPDNANHGLVASATDELFSSQLVEFQAALQSWLKINMSYRYKKYIKDMIFVEIESLCFLLLLQRCSE